MKILKFSSFIVVLFSFHTVQSLESKNNTVDTSLASIVPVMEKHGFIVSLEETKKNLMTHNILDDRMQNAFIEVWEFHLIDYKFFEVVGTKRLLKCCKNINNYSIKAITIE